MKKTSLVAILVFLVSINLVAQEKNSLKTRKAQVTFAYPVGSNGMSSMEYSNNFSFNILYGLNGGVNGAEIGSIVNYNKGEVKGFQLSGALNVNTAYSKGFLLSGVSNICLDSVSGILISGALNYSKQQTKGFQLAGVSNICLESASGILISGALNYSKQQAKGFQLAGVSNICLDSASGILISGALNYSKQQTKGVQLATANISSEKFSGLQLGVFNSAKKVKGIQLGVFNYLNDGEGALPIGLFSIVKNGYYELELTGGEVIYSNLNYKMGVEKFYTIYKAGYSSYKNKPVYSSGIGFGGNISISEKQKISIDLSSNEITYNNNWKTTKLNLLNKADFNYKYSVTKKLSLLIGTSFNVYVTKEKVDGKYGTLDIPYTIMASEGANSMLSMWLGFNAGLSIKL